MSFTFDLAFGMRCFPYVMVVTGMAGEGGLTLDSSYPDTGHAVGLCFLLSLSFCWFVCYKPKARVAKPAIVNSVPWHEARAPEAWAAKAVF